VQRLGEMAPFHCPRLILAGSDRQAGRSRVRVPFWVDESIVLIRSSALLQYLRCSGQDKKLVNKYPNGGNTGGRQLEPVLSKTVKLLVF
jgi:hypothetical protein